MNEQKLINFCMLIPKGIGHCFGYFLVAMTTSRADNYGCFWWTSFLPLARHVYKKDMHKGKEKKKKNGTETQIEILDSVFRLQQIFMRALAASKALKTSHTVLTNVTVSPHEHWCQNCSQTNCSQTVSSHFSIKKDDIFMKQNCQDCTFLTEEVCDSCFPWMFGKSQTQRQAQVISRSVMLVPIGLDIFLGSSEMSSFLFVASSIVLHVWSTFYHVIMTLLWMSSAHHVELEIFHNCFEASETERENQWREKKTVWETKPPSFLVS